MTSILGISAFYHDSAAALVVDGQIVAAAQEERFSRVKHDASFPVQAIDYCLRAAGLAKEDLNYIVFYDKPLRKFERLLETWLAFAPRGFLSYRQALPVWLREKLDLRGQLARHFPWRKNAFVFLEHHESHAASAFFPSPYEQAAILTIDGVGEWATACCGSGEGNRIHLTKDLRFPHSLGLLYSAFTTYCGFKVNSGEYKLMGLAPYGQPRYVDLILEKLIDLRPDGSFWLNTKYIGYCTGLRMTNRRFHQLFDGSPREPESPLTEKHLDIAASIQAVVEQVVARMARHVLDETGLDKLVLAGGVALNCVANGQLLRKEICRSIWVQPAAGDAGGALGAALFVWHQLLDRPRTPQLDDSQQGALLGPEFTDQEIADCLSAQGIPFTSFESESELLQEVARRLAEEEIVGWFQGRMEFGPRALGARSILGDPRRNEMQSRMNQKIKFRESFRPFAPSVLAERAGDWFEWPAGEESPYMLLTAPVRAEHRRQLTDDERITMQTDPDLTRRVSIPRSSIPAVTHVDYSARLQTVDAMRFPKFHRLLKSFDQLTGCPMLVNTSFNVRGEPIVCTPQDALRCFQATEMDSLAIGNCLVSRQAQQRARSLDTASHLAQFALD